MNDASSDARKTTALATSSGLPVLLKAFAVDKIGQFRCFPIIDHVGFNDAGG